MTKAEERFNKWLEKNQYHEGMLMHGNAAIIVRDDNMPMKVENGHEFIAMDNQSIFNAGYATGKQFNLNELQMIATFLGPKDIPTEIVEGKNKLIDKIRKLISEENN